MFYWMDDQCIIDVLLFMCIHTKLHTDTVQGLATGAAPSTGLVYMMA